MPCKKKPTIETYAHLLGNSYCDLKIARTLVQYGKCACALHNKKKTARVQACKGAAGGPAGRRGRALKPLRLIYLLCSYFLRLRNRLFLRESEVHLSTTTELSSESQVELKEQSTKTVLQSTVLKSYQNSAMYNYPNGKN